MSKASKHGGDTHWISLSDMMTSLMMVFLFVAILFMYQIQKPAADYQQKKAVLYQELNTEFKDKFKEWDMTLTPDLTIKFTNPDVLFDYQSSTLTPRFQTILEEFIPEYLSIITEPKFKDVISEVRIEGNTADWGDYMYTIRLSQDRADSVLGYILSEPSYLKLPQSEQDQIKFWLTANGLGNGREIDSDGNYVFDTKNAVSVASRRVEFKIVTNSDDVINQVINSSK